MILNVDGVVQYKSISTQLWSILRCFHKLSSFIVRIYYGNKKSSNLEEFVLELFTKYRNSQNEDREFRGVRLDIEILSFVCDDRATHSLKFVKSHNEYWCWR